MSPRLRHALVAAVVGLSLVDPSSAQAHPAITYYFELHNPASVPYRFTAGFPTSPTTYRASVNNGFNAWNPQSASFQATKQSTDFSTFSPFYNCNPGYVKGTNAVHWSAPSSNALLGQTVRCYSTTTGEILTTQIIINPTGAGHAWYTGTGTPPASSADMWSVAAHEVGHFTGFYYGGPAANPGHWANSDTTLCPSTTTRHTMCESTPLGTTMMRTLNTHDIHTFQGAYP